MADPRIRLRFTEGGFNVSAPPLTVVSGPDEQYGSSVLPCKEWSISDDVMSLSDTACVTIPNVDGEHSGKIQLGQKVEIEESDDDVANGQWVPSFKGVVTDVRTGSDVSGGSVISVTMQDLGWFLTKCAAQPLVNIKNRRFKQLLELLIDPSWGIGEVVASNDLNRRIKHGRQVIVQNFKPQLGAVLPFIQVEPGQKPADIILQYAAREGVLVNVSADGKLVFFRPDYSQQALYSALYAATTDPLHTDNNVLGRPEVSESIEGLFGEIQCWSTVVIDPSSMGPADAENPNAAFRHTTYPDDFKKAKQPDPRFVNPLPFNRREVFSDPEAINDKLRWTRCVWKQQMGQFQSWTYTVRFDRHSQNGAFFVSDTMISVDDRVNKVRGLFYVQSVNRSQTIREGTVTTLTVRKPVLDPENTALNYGGTKGSSKTKPRGKAKLSSDLARLLK